MKADKTRDSLPILPRGMGRYDYQHNGSIRLRKKVTFYGHSREISATGKTLAIVNSRMKAKERDFEMEVKLGHIDGKEQTLQSGIEEWMSIYKCNVDGVKSTSYDRLNSVFQNHILNSSLGLMPISEVTSDDIQIYLKSLKNKRNNSNLSYSSKIKVYELVDGFLKHYYAREPFLNPMVQVIKPKKPVKDRDNELIIWNDREMEKLSKVGYEAYIPGKSGFKHGLGIIFMMYCFLRENEALALTMDDFNFEKGTVFISRAFNRIHNRDDETGEVLSGYQRVVSTPKYGSKRKIKLPQPALNAILELQKRYPDNYYLFDNGNGEPISEFTLIRSYEQMRIRAELPKQKNVTLHGLRHTGISYYLRHGVPVEVISKMAGHKSIQVTLDTYYSVLEEQKDNAIDVFNKKYAEE